LGTCHHHPGATSMELLLVLVLLLLLQLSKHRQL
jgi:hypothetical protein